VKRNWTSIVANYLFVALLGVAGVLVGTEFWRAHYVRATLARSECVLEAGHPGAALAHLNRVKPWSASYEALERRRLCLVVRCHVLRMEMAEAQAAAAIVLDANPDLRLALGQIAPMDYMLTSLVDFVWLRRDPGVTLGPWAGYRALIRELRLQGRDDAVEAALERGAARFPDGHWPDDVLAFVCDRPAPMPSPAVRRVFFTPAPAPAATSSVAATPPSSETPTGEPAPAAAESGRWAVVRALEGHAYDVSGKFQHPLPTGSLLDVQEVRDTASGRLAVCRGAGADPAGAPIVVPWGELDMHVGRLADADPTERELRSRRAVVAARIERSRQAHPADAALSEANPHATAYRKARGDLDALRRRAESAQARWETSTGGERMKYADELRSMKPEQVRLEADCEKARVRAEEWAAANPPSNPEDDEAELAGIDKQLETF
jgi:hypothetical protein